MERIQIALEKARARRASQGGLAPAAAAQTATAAAVATAPYPSPAAVEAVVPSASVRTAPIPAPPSQDAASKKVHDNWKALSEFLPRPELMTRNRILGFTGGRDAAPIDMMRTKILQEMRKNGWRRMAVTSPNAGCGKTTTCLNLAFSLGRQPNHRTVLVDLDMRRPGLAKMLGMKTPQSMANVISGHSAPADHLQRYGMNLAFGTNTTSARNPAELLHGAEVGPALSRIEIDYDPTVMIFDLPPMMMCDDMMAFAPHVDCVLLLAAAEATPIDDLDRCERELAGATNVLGVVLNKCRYTDPSYGYGYY